MRPQVAPLCMVLIITLIVPAAHAGADRNSDVSMAAKIKDGVLRLGIAASTVSEVTLQNGQIIRGRVYAADSSGVLLDIESGVRQQVPYSDIRSTIASNAITGKTFKYSRGMKNETTRHSDVKMAARIKDGILRLGIGASTVSEVKLQNGQIIRGTVCG